MSWFSSSERRKKLATGGFYSIQFGRTLPPASFAVPQKADVAPAAHISKLSAGKQVFELPMRFS
jgi:hypothetical protein